MKQFNEKMLHACVVGAVREAYRVHGERLPNGEMTLNKKFIESVVKRVVGFTKYYYTEFLK